MRFGQSTLWSPDFRISFLLNHPGIARRRWARPMSPFLSRVPMLHGVRSRQREINRDSISSEATQIGNYPQKLVPHNFDGKTNLGSGRRPPRPQPILLTPWCGSLYAKFQVRVSSDRLAGARNVPVALIFKYYRCHTENNAAGNNS